MSRLNEFGGSMSFRASVNESALRLPHPSSMLIQLADESEWLEEKVGGFKEVIIRYHGKEHRFTPDEVLRALYAARDEPIIRCKDCKHFTANEEFWIGPPEAPFPMIGTTGDSCDFWAGTKCKVEPDGFCKWAELREDA